MASPVGRVKDHRLHGSEVRALDKGKPAHAGTVKDSDVDALIVKLAEEEGKQLTSEMEFQDWVSTLPAGKQKGLRREYFKRLLPLSMPLVMHFMSDYREVAAGCWMPMSQGYDNWEVTEQGKTAVTSRREMKVIQATVNAPLADELFMLPFKKGVEIWDNTQDTPRKYVLDADEPATRPAAIDWAEPQGIRLNRQWSGDGSEALDLDRQQVHDFPDKQALLNDEQEAKRWFAHTHADLIARFEQDRWQLLSAGTKLVPVSNEAWETADFRQLTAALEAKDPGEALDKTDKSDFYSGDRRYRLDPQAKMPLTYAFRTAEGPVGMLRVLDQVRGNWHLEVLVKLVKP